MLFKEKLLPCLYCSMTKQHFVYRTGSRQFQEVVLYAAHVAASTNINVL